MGICVCVLQVVQIKEEDIKIIHIILYHIIKVYVIHITYIDE